MSFVVAQSEILRSKELLCAKNYSAKLISKQRSIIPTFRKSIDDNQIYCVLKSSKVIYGVNVAQREREVLPKIV